MEGRDRADTPHGASYLIERSAWRSGWPGCDCAGRPLGRDVGLFIRGNEVLQQKLIWKDLPPGAFPPLGLVIQPELFAFPAEGVAMNPQSLGCL